MGRLRTSSVKIHQARVLPHAVYDVNGDAPTPLGFGPLKSSTREKPSAMVASMKPAQRTRQIDVPLLSYRERSRAPAVCVTAVGRVLHLTIRFVDVLDVQSSSP